MSAPAAPQYDSLVRVGLPLLTLSLGAVIVEGLWAEESPTLTVRQWRRGEKPSVANWRAAAAPLRPVDWKKA